MDKSIFVAKPTSNVCTCIICHRNQVEASDEHIIPKALGGYMHTWKVCKECNSIMGHKVDSLITTQYFITFERYKHQLRGQSGEAVKNPLIGTFPGEDGNKYKIEEEEGKLISHLVTSTKISDDGNQLSIIVDGRDKEKVGDIIAKFCKRKGYELPEKIPELAIEKKPAPAVQIQSSINIADISLAMLKIAYEFTACMLPEYIHDAEAKKIAEILLSADSKRLNEIQISTNIFEDVFQPIFGNYIDFSKNTRHYILLINIENKLCCFVKLFNLFCVPLVMSNQLYKDIDQPIIAINDFAEKDFNIFSMEELLQIVTTKTNYVVKFVEPFDTELQQIVNPFGILCNLNDQHNLCYNLLGKYIGTDYELMAKMPEESVEQQVEENCIRNIFHMDGKVCFRLVGSNLSMQLVPIDKIVLESEIRKY